MKLLGEILRQRRRAISPEITIKQVAKQAGLVYLTVQQIETGVQKNPGVLTVEAIEGALTHFETPGSEKNDASKTEG